MSGSEQNGQNDSALNILNLQLANMSTENQYVTFKIGEEEYGVDIMLVQEIIRYKKPTKIYNANPMIKGIINFRGKVIPIIDMHKKFDLGEQNYDEYTVVIVIEVESKTMGMIVDRVSDIMSFKKEEIQIVDQEFAEDIKTEHLKGMAKSRDRIIMLLEPNRVLSFRELNQISKAYGEDEANLTKEQI
ncbi:purine-binding chemotaxis protein CheW [Desulfitispora alkaliphila]|uniref:chemotaxis protein CheW n=1 Tax=Desulfitispora alkaliphila TaxID=622674 RepID=UPI003D1D0FD6